MSDAFGKALADYLAGKKVKVKFIRDDGQTKEGGIESYFSTYNQWPKFEKEAIKYAKGKVLDVGAGAGRHALYLQNKGLVVYAVDQSAGAGNVMRERGVVKVYIKDAMHLDAYFGRKFFGSVLMMCNNFGIFGTKEKTLKFLNKLDALTADDATIITTIRDYMKTDNKQHHNYQEENVKAGRHRGQVRISIEYKNSKGPWFELLLMTPADLKDLLKETNWHVKKIIPHKKKDELEGMYAAIIEKKKNQEMSR